MLHVTNGDLLATRIAAAQAAGHVPAGDLLPWRDVLHEGPVPSGGDAWLRASRAAFLSAAGQGDAAAIETALQARDERLDAALAAEEGIVLWFDGDLYDRLQLGQVAARLVAARAAGMLIEVDERGRADVAELWGTRRQLPAFLVATLAAEWEALRDGRLDEVPLRLRQELPWTTDGLALSERLALLAIEAGAESFQEVFAAQAALEERPFLGDVWLRARLRGLAALLDGGAAASAAADAGTGADTTPYALSALGRAVLGGQTDAVAACGLDRWVGAVRLTAGEHLRWEPQTGTVVRYASPR